MVLLELLPGASYEEILQRVDEIAPHARLLSFQGSRWIVSPAPLRKRLGALDGVLRSIEVNEPFPLASKAFGGECSTVKVGKWIFGDAEPVVIAGPCSVESREQLLHTARHLAASGCHILRGGATDP